MTLFRTEIILLYTKSHTSAYTSIHFNNKYVYFKVVLKNISI